MQVRFIEALPKDTNNIAFGFTKEGVWIVNPKALACEILLVIVIFSAVILTIYLNIM